jgi:hypothetical protein
MSDQYGLIAAIFSAIATFLAAIASWRAPITAAKLAEMLRSHAEQTNEQKRAKLRLFTTLMQERAAIFSESAVQSLNLIDVVFNDCAEVREAWSELFFSFDSKNHVPEHAQQERLRKLLAAMAREVGLADKLKTDDLGRVYFPTILAQDQFIKNMERQNKLQQLQNETSPTANTASPSASIWPPKPI